MAENKEEKAKSSVAKREEEILAFWQEKKIFEKTLEQTKSGKPYVFYDGPPFATGLPHYGHVLASTIKDAIPRYQTMRGRYVERRWGWDCHGLPIENIVEKDLGISGRKQIEEIGIKKFNEHARNRVLEFVGEWKKTVQRIGRWVDFDGSYKTMDNTYIESVWWAIKRFYEKGLVYEGTRVLPYCPRCETPIANSEIAMDSSYKDITDISVYVKFELLEKPNTFVLAWTTTPWTLPGNFALAINPDIEYVEAKIEGEAGIFILAKERVAHVLKDRNYSTLPPFKGGELVGKKYKPIFDYFTGVDFKNKNNAWEIYPGDFVNVDSGTGVVHVSPGYGEDDLNIAKRENIPFVHHVAADGTFTAAVADFAGLSVKPKSADSQGHQITDIEIIKKMSRDGTLFDKEKIIHSYPHCFRCETPLFYYAIPAWFINIQNVMPKMLELNEKINWVPAHLKEGRFKKSLEGAPDWNISRNRFWASPLPIWKCSECQRTEVIGGLSDLQSHTKSDNKYYVMRHGEAESNVKGIVSSDKDAYGLSEKGKRDTTEEAYLIQKKGLVFDYIFYSPFKRTHDTALAVKEMLGIPDERFIADPRLHEISFGEFNNRSVDEYHAYFLNYEERFTKAPEGGESQQEVKIRMGKMLYDIEENYRGSILFVTHDSPAWLLFAAASGLNKKETLTLHDGRKYFIENAGIRELPFSRMPLNDHFEIDLHRPYADDIAWTCKNCKKGKMKRISEVVDCWLESGSMPFAQVHYPFENKDKFDKNFPAQFITEYIAQTRTWFYYTHAVSTMLFGNLAFQNVVTTGTILAEDGSKMSKSKSNFPDPRLVFDRYGVDALRFYLLSSPIMRSEDLNFSEKEVDGVYKKNILRLRNVLEFFKLYTHAGVHPSSSSTNILDRWIVTRLGELTSVVTENLDNYLIDQATRPFELFIDDLSTWYLRRSRDRLKNEGNDKENALSTMSFVLLELARLLAPITPFIADDLYLTLKGPKESVHLETWPIAERKFSIFNFQFSKSRRKIIDEMAEVRRIVSLGLEARSKVGVKVRQPLSRLTVKVGKLKLEKEYMGLIRDEVNVKEVIFDEKIAGDVELDTVVSPELKEEGMTRELIRTIQDFRKKGGLAVGQIVDITVETDEIGKNLFEKNKAIISRQAQLRNIIYQNIGGESTLIGDISFKFEIRH